MWSDEGGWVGPRGKLGVGIGVGVGAGVGAWVEGGLTWGRVSWPCAVNVCCDRVL